MSNEDDQPRVSREGIFIDRQLADAIAIEEDLDSNVVGPYQFPDPRRRRTSAWIYLGLAVLAGWLFEPMAAVIPAALGAWHLASAWPLKVGQEQALSQAATAVRFPIGHASAALTFHGIRARPRWSVILYSASDPPDRRALVTVDAVGGEQVGDAYTEDIPPP